MDISSRRRALPVLAGSALVLLGATVAPALAVNADHGNAVVSSNPANYTPHVMNGSVNAITQVGNEIIAAGTFTRVSPAGTYGDTSDDLVRNRIFAFDATSGAIDTSFDPNLGGAANSLDTDGTNIYVGGSFGSVGGSSAFKRVVKMTADGVVDTTFRAVPNSGVNEVVLRGSRLYLGGGFTTIKSGSVTSHRAALAALDPSTGAALPDVNVPFTGVYDPNNNYDGKMGGSTNVKRFDVTPDGSRLVAIGNFSTVGGQPHSQLAVLDTSGSTATVANWSTTRFDRINNACAAKFDSFTRDLDISPDGSYFVVSATGAFAGGAASGTMCDSTSRWETYATGSSLQPTWQDYTGGDTTYGVAITGSAVYVGGHFRWENNPFQGDQAGPGAVPRSGIAALDPVNGLPLSWNPGRTRGVGAQALFATSRGLWVGSDTTRFKNELHGRVAFLPLAGGETVPAAAAATLPNDLFAAQRPSCSATGVLYRVNAGGPALQPGDGSPGWTTDDAYRNTGNSGGPGTPAAVDSTVPACTTPNIFATERYDPSTAPEMHFGFPVRAGQQVTVRLYFSDRCDCTATVGSRVFSVLIDGHLALDHFDIDAQAGHDRGTMRQFPITSDGTVDIDFRHVKQNPTIDGIEIIDATTNGPTSVPGALLRRPLGSDATPVGPAATANTSIDWAQVRGAFYLNGTLFYGLPDGGLYTRTFDPATGELGAQQTVDLNDDPDTGQRIPFAITDLTGMFYDTTTHRIYYTVSGDNRLYYRYFTPESKVVGAQTFVGTSNGVDFGAVAGMTLAGSRILYGSATDGSLRSVPFANGAVTGSPSVVSSDGSWNDSALFVPND